MAEFKAEPSKIKTIRRPPVNAIPDEIRNDPVLNQWITKCLPDNYNFEIHKIIHRLRQAKCKRVCLQFPEGLFIFSTPIAEIIRQFAICEVIIMGDVTYGACCVDDYVASLNGCDFIIHFAHSCLIPVNEMIDGVKVLYIFVDIKFDLWHALETIKSNFPVNKYIGKKIALAGSIQFVSSVHHLAKELKNLGYDTLIPQAKPLSPGEVLGCTSPRLAKDVDIVLFVCDGRFHLEAMMIANPTVSAFYKYNPYNKEITREEYDQKAMLRNREGAIRLTMELLSKNDEIVVGLILGTLGHQGNPKILNNLKSKILEIYPECQFISILIPEISASILNSFGDSVHVWVQISCPRLSIDWATDVIQKPLLTPFEFNWALKKVFEPIQDYPMDFYASNSLGNWTPNHKCNNDCSCSV